jgi:hypothetical protein
MKEANKKEKETGMLRRFLPDAHYVQGFDPYVHAPYVFLMQEARELAIQYYSEKYKAVIFFLESFRDLRFHLAKLDKTTTNYRAGFFIGKINQHSIPVVYLREQGEEALFYTDSQGHQTEVLSQIKKQSTLPVYSTEEKRQGDFYSCAIDALVFLRDCTAFQTNSEEYYLPRLLAKLKARSQPEEAYFRVKLPDALLKAPQQSFFVKQHKEISHPLIHKKETLNEFRQRYSTFFLGKTQAAYLRIKGIKLAHLIEIQFYINELKRLAQQAWTPLLRKAFIRQAKLEFTQQGDFFLNPHRAGLYNLATYFLEKMKNEPHSLLISSYRFSEDSTPRVTQIAETLLELIHDNTYWKQKTFWGFGIPDGLALMQKELQACPDSLIAKIYTVRKIALSKRETKSIFYLVTGTDERDPSTDNFYKLFSEDWLNTPLLEVVLKDWTNTQPPKEVRTLPSMEDYKRVRIRY